jgi:hypothetical protein
VEFSTGPRRRHCLGKLDLPEPPERSANQSKRAQDFILFHVASVLRPATASYREVLKQKEKIMQHMQHENARA